MRKLASELFIIAATLVVIILITAPGLYAQDPEQDTPQIEEPNTEGELTGDEDRDNLEYTDPESSEVGLDAADNVASYEVDPFLAEGSFTKAAVLDSVYNVWMMPDTQGVRSYWFRKGFVIDEPPSGGHIWLTADDDYNLFINGTYIAAGDKDTIDWMEVNDYDVSPFLKLGDNLIAIEASDIDSSGQGLMVGLVYETIPDIERQLEKMVEREVEEQERRLAEALARAAGEPVFEPPSQQKLKEIRTIRKNKLY